MWLPEPRCLFWLTKPNQSFDRFYSKVCQRGTLAKSVERNQGHYNNTVKNENVKIIVDFAAKIIFLFQLPCPLR